MAGLLYKDFVAIKGKIYVAVMAGVLGVFLGLRLAVRNEMIDVLICMLYTCIVLTLYFFVLSNIEISLITVDEKRNQKNYFLSLPVSKQKYIASKYILLFIIFYVIMSFSVLLGMICRVNCRDAGISQLVQCLTALMPVLTCLLLFVPSVELPFFIGFGAGKGNQIRTGVVIILFFLAVIYMMFGDLSVISVINPNGMVSFMDRHRNKLMVAQVFMPWLGVGVYYLSYRISCLLFERREWEND